jgi:tetratricopeptide (TPR) repeat protein
VFVSSTFKDMGAERDELSKRAFVELRRLCEERGVAWTDVDLRWGITDEQKAEGEVLPICLAEIENCRPYFLGILGERFGWVPDEIPKEQVDREPWLAEDRGRSVTEMEIVHGVLNDPEMARHAFFYFRDPNYVETVPVEAQSDYRELPTAEEVHSLGLAEAEKRAEDRRRRLVELKERIETGGFPVRRFRNPEELGPLVVQDLKGVVDRLFPADSSPGPLERTRAVHEGVVRDARRIYVPCPAYFRRLDENALGDRPPLVVLGDPGSGKSALLANWAHEHRQRAPGELLVFHFVGASPESASWDGMLRRLLAELTRQLGGKLDIPEHPEALRQTFAKALHATAAVGRVVLIIDGLDQLEDRDQALDLTWLPPDIPSGVRLVLSTLPGRPLDELTRRGWPTLQVEPLVRDEQSQLVRDYLASYRKALSGEHLERILTGSLTSNPLFLRTLLEELRFHGDHFTLGRVIDHYLDSPGLPELFEKVLNRFEEDYERGRPGLVRDTLTFLHAARRGLSEDEILDLLGPNGQRLPRAIWSPFHLAAGHLLTNRSGFLGFCNDLLRQAVEARYLRGEKAQQAVHRSLADYFATRDAGPRRLDEFPWQLSRSHAWDELAALLADLDFLTDAWQADEFDVKRYWAEIEHHSTLRMIDAYGEAIQRPLAHRDCAWTLAGLLSDTGYMDEALGLRRTLSEQARSSGELGDLMTSLGNEAHLLKATGKWDQALEVFEEQEDIARRVERKSSLDTAIGSLADIRRAKEEPRLALAFAQGGQGSIHRVRGQLKLALELFRKEELVHRKDGNLEGLQYCLGNQSLVLVEQSDLSGAMELRQEQERICREIGQVDGLRRCVEAQSVILRMRRDLEGALRLNREAERICRELGDRSGLATTLSNQGVILRENGDFDGALGLYQETERICRDLGERQDLAVALNNQASIFLRLGEIEKAMNLFEEVEEISRSLGYAIGLQAALCNQGHILIQHGDTGKALRCLEEAEEICREMGYPLGLAECLNLKCMALNMLGREEEAEVTSNEALDLVEEHGLSRK